MGRKRIYYFADKFKCLLTAILFVFIWFIHKTYFLLYLPETIQCLGQDIHLLFADQISTLNVWSNKILQYKFPAETK